MLKDKVSKERLIICGFYIFYMFTLLHGLMNSALWGDEWVEYFFSQAKIETGDLYDKIVSTFQPPLYNFIMHFWLRISNDILWFRLFNIIPAIVTGIFVYLIIRKIYNYKVGLCALLLLAGCYQWIYCVQECSEYCLMIMFLAGGLFFFVQARTDRALFSIVAFVISCIGAMYSQYGAFFVVAPLLIVFLIETCLSKDKRLLVIVMVSYLFALLYAAIPLYFEFAQKQMLSNAITENATLSLSNENIKQIFTTAGDIIGYLWNYKARYEHGNGLLRPFNILFLIGIIWVFIRSLKKRKYVIAEFMAIYLAAYIMHYFLVVFQIYAMAHPNVSGGFFTRYSYFYIPLLAIIIPMVVAEIKNDAAIARCLNSSYANGIIIGGLAGLLFFVSLPEIMPNWHKSYDNLFAAEWLKEEGYNDTTYLLGIADYGFDYYITREYGEEYSTSVYLESEIDYNNLPETFWVWRTNWGGDNFYPIIENAERMGYTIDILRDNGYQGQLARCSIKK